MNRNTDIVKLCLIANMKRVLQILESDIEIEYSWKNSKEKAEIRNKMHEIRRDSIELDKKLRY